MPPPFPPPKAPDLETMKKRDAESPWKKKWHGNGEPEPILTYSQWLESKYGLPPKDGK